MKVITLQPIKDLYVAEQLIAVILRSNANAFNGTNKQFIKNNKAVFSGFSGMSA